MKYGKIFCILILVLSGCQGGKQTGDALEKKVPATTKQRSRTLNSDLEVKIDISNMPEIITSVSQKLDINLEQQDVKVGRYTYTGVSPSGIKIKIEAVALVKGRSVLIVSVTGEQEEISVMNPLLQIISNSLRTAVRNQN